MPFFLILLAFMLFVAAARGQIVPLAKQFGSDISAFVPWMVIVGIVAIVGLSKTLRPISNAAYVLIFAALIIGSGSKILTGLQSLTKTS